MEILSRNGIINRCLVTFDYIYHAVLFWLTARATFVILPCFQLVKDHQTESVDKEHITKNIDEEHKTKGADKEHEAKSIHKAVTKWCSN